jgi:hypothetical protein
MSYICLLVVGTTRKYFTERNLSFKTSACLLNQLYWGRWTNLIKEKH